MPINKLWLWIPVGLILIVFLFWPEQDEELVVHNSMDQTEIVETNIESKESDDLERNQVVVDVKGEVNKPGVYELNQGQRVVDVIEMAGGMTANADETSVNLAMLLSDEMVIHVLAKQQNIGDGDQSVTTTNQNNKIRINVAGVDELTQIPGIGEAKAAAIVQYREENGYFKTAEDLLNISGIGEKTLERMKEFIMVP
ncbi:helix-hairpin-helix domain-containing protein [Piscibacillus salipiscarius]|uniref:Helix-hairpin-helix domain-containing protein n=1 Tax=Piscibacillus salipiscarius TaxID=299480 RepID=A0ABW5Q6P2_9BACI|nr:helix-hairpin-helix domain-containing protein [Piscibacillus salipiscarius]